MSFAAFWKPASVTEKVALLSEAAIGRSAWRLSSRRPRECSASDGDATATLAAIATTTSGAAMSRNRLRMWCSFLWVGLPARAQRQSADGGMEAPTRGTTRVELPRGKLVERSRALGIRRARTVTEPYELLGAVASSLFGQTIGRRSDRRSP